MHTEAAIGLRAPTLLGFSTSSVAAALVMCAMLLSSVVFSEPAPADAMMMGVIAGVPLLGAAWFGPFTKLQLVLWFIVVGFGVLATPMSTVVETAIIHQSVTLFLALGAFVLAGYISADPVPRFRMIIWCYVIGVCAASIAAIIGYFDILPAFESLFTNYGRARGTFKDPNVLGAAIAPALVFAAWMTLRERAVRMLAASVLFAILGVTLLITFSRGAWLSTAVSMAVLVAIALLRTRRRSDFQRMALVSVVGTAAVIGTLALALQNSGVAKLMDQRASLDQSYDLGPEGRFGGQEKAKKLVLENPFGIGTHTFRETYHHEEPHNVYLSMFLNAGWIGGLMYIVSVLSTLFVGLRGSFQMTALQGPFLIATAAFAGLVVEGLIIDSDHWRHFYIIMGCIWGLADATVPVIDPSGRRPL
jgi:O-antigen ligase